MKRLRREEKQSSAAEAKLSAALDHILQAQHPMVACVKDLKAAHQASTLDAVGHNWAAFTEHSRVGSAASHAQKAKLFMEQARRIDSTIGVLHHPGVLNIHMGSFVRQGTVIQNSISLRPLPEHKAFEGKA